MQAIIETPSLESDRSPTQAQRGEAWWPLFAAVVVLPFANGHYSIALAAWLAPLFLLRFTRSVRPALGFLVAFLLQAAALVWQYRGMVPLPSLIYWLVIVAYAAGFSLPYLADRLLAHRLPEFAGTLVFPFFWTAIEYTLLQGPFGSWFATAYSQYGNLALLQILSVSGLWGVTFLIGWAASAGNSLWESWLAARRIPRVVWVSVASIIAVTGAGGARLAFFPPSAKTVRVASLSKLETSLHPDPKVVDRFFRHLPLSSEETATIREGARAIDDDLLQRSEREARAGARIIFWGEANAPVLKEDESDLVRRGGEIAQRNNIYLGMVLASWHLETTPPFENKIVLVEPSGRVAWEFFKAHPVPGGEAAISIRGDGKVRVLETPYGRVSSIICFDADFPKLLAQAGRLGADIVLDPSNDWRAIDPWHTRMASFRAIEQGFNLVRHTSQGLSAAFDYQGRQIAAMDHYVTTDRVLVSQVPTHGVRTLYSIFGDWFAWICAVGVVALILIALKRRA
jgi:apolipoprotein N-acyltransferase